MLVCLIYGAERAVLNQLGVGNSVVRQQDRFPEEFCFTGILGINTESKQVTFVTYGILHAL